MEEKRDKIDRVLDELLEYLARYGDVEFPLTEEFVREFERTVPDEKLTPEEEHALYLAARSAHHDTLFREVRKSGVGSNLTFGQLIKTLRERANLYTEIAERIGIPYRQLLELEDDRLDALQLPAVKICNLLEVFSVRLSEALGAIRRSMILRVERQGAGQALARSTDTPGSLNRGLAANEALDKLLVRANEDRKSIYIGSELIGDLSRELVARGREDLVK